MAHIGEKEKKGLTAQQMELLAKQNLSCGSQIRITKTSYDSRHHAHVKTKMGQVIGVYRHCIMVQIGDRCECFRLNEIFGNEEIKVRIGKEKHKEMGG